MTEIFKVFMGVLIFGLIFSSSYMILQNTDTVNHATLNASTSLTNSTAITQFDIVRYPKIAEFFNNSLILLGDKWMDDVTNLKLLEDHLREGHIYVTDRPNSRDAAVTSLVNGKIILNIVMLKDKTPNNPRDEIRFLSMILHEIFHEKNHFGSIYTHDSTEIEKLKAIYKAENETYIYEIMLLDKYIETLSKKCSKNKSTDCLWLLHSLINEKHFSILVLNEYYSLGNEVSDNSIENLKTCSITVSKFLIKQKHTEDEWNDIDESLKKCIDKHKEIERELGVDSTTIL